MKIQPLISKPKYGVKYEFNDLGFGIDVNHEIYILWEEDYTHYYFDGKSGQITMLHNCWNKHIINKEIIIIK